MWLTKVLFEGPADKGWTYFGNESGPHAGHRACGVLPHVLTISAYTQAACSEYEFQVALRWLCPRLAGRVIIMFVVPPADVKRHDNLEEPRLYSYRRIPLRSMSWKFDRELRPCGRKCALLFEGFKSSRR